MERLMKYVILAIVFVSLKVQCYSSFPPIEAHIDGEEFPLEFPPDNVTIPLTGNITLSGKRPLLVIPKNGTITIVEIPPDEFPVDKTIFTIIPPTNRTALNILSRLSSDKDRNLSELPCKNDKSNEYSIESKAEVEDVQASDNTFQSDELEENYKSNVLPLLPIDFDDDTEVDHPMLKTTHILGIITLSLAVLCACVYLGLTIWRQIIFNRYGDREMLTLNKDGSYSTKSIYRNF